MPNSEATVLCNFTCDVCGKTTEDLSAPFSINPVFGNFYTKLRKMGWVVLEYKGEYTKYVCPSCVDKISSWFYDNNQKEVSEIEIEENGDDEKRRSLKMNDREFLLWMYYRLVNVHGERELYDYMHKFRAIISEYPEDKNTPNDGRGENSIKKLEEKFSKRYNNNQEEVAEIQIVEEEKETGLDVLIERIERLNFHRNLDAISTEDLTDSEEWKWLMKFILETNGKLHKAKMQMFRCPDCGYKIGFEEFMTELKED